MANKLIALNSNYFLARGTFNLWRGSGRPLIHYARGFFRSGVALVAVWFQSPLNQVVNSSWFDATGTGFTWFNRHSIYFCIDLSDGNDNLDARLQDCTSATVPGALFWVLNFPPLS